MRKMLLSFKPNVYEKIYNGIKIFEHRRNFPDEPIMAYMYVSKPVRAIMGIVYLSNRHVISEWKEEFKEDAKAVERIKGYGKSYRYAMEILEFQETTEIGLDDLKRDILNFVAPQSYIYLDNNLNLLEYIENKIQFKDVNVKNDFSSITSDQVCVN